MKKNLILVILLGIAPLQFVGQTQVSIDPNSTVQQLNFSSLVIESTGNYYACGMLPVGNDFGMVVCFSNSGIYWSNYFSPANIATLEVVSDGLLVAGERIQNGFVSHVDQNGNLVWVTNISTGGEYVTDIMDVSGLSIYGVGGSSIGGMFLVKLSPTGILTWEKRPATSSGNVDYPKILLQGDSLLVFDGTITGAGISGDVALRILDQNCVESFHRIYGVPGNVRDQLTSVIKMPDRYVIATSRLGAVGVIVLDRNFNIAKSRSYTIAGGNLENGKLLYDNGSLFLSCDRNASGVQRVILAKLDTTSLNVVWTKGLSSANSFPACEPFMDGTVRVPYMRYPSLSGSVRGVMLASIDPTTGNFTGVPCESPPVFSLVAGPYTGLIQTDQPISTWSDVALAPPPSYTYGSYPLLLEDCDPGTLPLELLYFVGEVAEEQTVRLSWATGSEENVEHFIVERSFDGVEWESIASVLPSGSVGVGATYGVIDAEPWVGQVNYYRLREVSGGGESVIFNIVSVFLESEDLVVHPNPIRRGEILRARAPTTLEISDVFGRPIVRNFSELLIELPSGNYIVSTTGSTSRARLVVVE